MGRKRCVVLGLLGTTLDAGHGQARWNRWRPTVALAQLDDLVVDRLELLHGARYGELANTVAEDIAQSSPETRVVKHTVEFRDPWDFEHVYETLLDFAEHYPFRTEDEDYLVHITTGTHVAQICLFLVTESRHIPGRLLQTAPGRGDEKKGAGTYTVIDLDLSKYDRLASRSEQTHKLGQSYLKSGIDTQNVAFNALISEIETVALASKAPMLLTGPTGAGKSLLARRIYELKKSRRQITGELASVNCATLRGDMAMSTLFGHTKGAFTGATDARAGLLKKAHQGILFLDEIGELGLDEQAMLLRAIEEKSFYPVGSDREVASDFILLCGTNRDLDAQVARGTFRDDLYARIRLWSFRLPALAERPEDITPNIDFEIDRASSAVGRRITFSFEARKRFLAFARDWEWPGNFRDLNATMTRMATLAPGGRITEDIVDREVQRLATTPAREAGRGLSAHVLGPARAAELDRFDRVQLDDVLEVCLRTRSISEAGRELFAVSRAAKSSANDADRLRKYLARFGIDFAQLRSANPA